VRTTGKPTPGQKRVLKAIQRLIARDGLPPTMRELCAELGYASTNCVAEHLLLLDAKGYIKRDPLKSRAIRVLRGAA
jgi:repressor LexA